MITAKRLLLPAALAATLGAAYWAPEESGELLPAQRNGASPRVAGASATAARPGAKANEPRVLEIRSRDDDGPEVPAFPASPKAAAAPAEPVDPTPLPRAAEAAAPAPPPPVFKVTGRYIEDGKTIAFLLHGEQGLVARAGDVLLDQYKVEKVTDTEVTLLGLALGQRLTIAMGALPQTEAPESPEQTAMAPPEGNAAAPPAPQ